MKWYKKEFQTKTNAKKFWSDEEILTIAKVADMMWEYKIKAKIQELKEKHKDYKVTISVLKELLKGE